MSLLHLLSFSSAKISLVVQISAVLFLVINLLVIGRLAAAVSNNRQLVIIAAMIITALYLPLNQWGLQGMEVSLLTLIISTSAWLAIRQLALERPFNPLTYGILAISTLIRPDMVVPYIVVMVFLVIFNSSHRKKHILIGGILLVVFLGSQTLFRIYYFGDTLPNTYYVKITGYPILQRLTRGTSVFIDFLFSTNWIVVTVPFVYAVFCRPNARRFLLLALFLGQACYSIYVGGDAWESYAAGNRYLSIVMPVLFVSICEVLSIAIRGFVDFLDFSRPQERMLSWIAIVFVALSVNGIPNTKSISRLLLFSKPIHASDNECRVKDALDLKMLTTTEATIAVAWAGSIPYFADRSMIDLLGKCDRVIARQPMHQNETSFLRFVSFYPGHLKWDYAYSIGQLRPDVVYELWIGSSAARPYLERDYITKKLPTTGRPIYLRKDSSKIRWEAIQ